MAAFTAVRGPRMRVTRMDECGAVVTGTCSQVVTDGFVTVNYSANIEEAEEILLKNAGGEICALDTTCPELKWYDLEMEFCSVDPDLFEIMTGQTIVEDFDMESVGVEVGTSINCDAGFALEVWAYLTDEACVGGQSSRSYGYFLIPWVINGILGDFTVENDAITFSVSGRSKNNHAWGQGPFDVVAQDSGGTAGPLLASMNTDSHLLMQKTTIAPPAVSDGCIAL